MNWRKCCDGRRDRGSVPAGVTIVRNERRRTMRITPLLALPLIVGCSSGSNFVPTGGKVCVAGVQIAWACPGGGTGAQACKDDGSGYGDCTGCGGGTHPDAGIGPGNPDMAMPGDVTSA